MIVNAVMLIYSRPVYTYVTLESLARSNIAKSGDFHLGAIIVDHPAFTFKAIRNMLSKYSFVDCPIVEQRASNDSGSYSTRLAHMMGYIYSHQFESDWFVFIENDVLFNPDWFERCMDMYEEAKDKFKVGVIGPFNNYHRGTVRGAYGNTFRGRSRFESQVWVMKPDILEKILDYPLKTWAEYTVGVDKRVLRALFDEGYMNISANDSYVAHIGYISCHKFPIRARSRGFKPQPAVEELLALAESSHDGCSGGTEWAENV